MLQPVSNHTAPDIKRLKSLPLLNCHIIHGEGCQSGMNLHFVYLHYLSPLMKRCSVMSVALFKTLSSASPLILCSLYSFNITHYLVDILTQRVFSFSSHCNRYQK